MTVMPSVPPGRQLATESVLLVEDQESVALAARRILSRQGYTVLTARDGSEALELLHSAKPPFDVVVTDLTMPRMGGLELIRRLSDLAPDLPIVYMSGYAEGGELDHDLARHTFLQKPFTIEALTTAVRTALGGRA